MSATRLLIVDDDATLPAVRSALAADPELEIVLVRSEWWRAAPLLRDARVDACIVDVTSAGAAAPLALRRFHQIDPGLRVVAVVDERDRRGRDFVEDAGADGLVLRQRIGPDLVPAVRRALGDRRRVATPVMRARGSAEPAAWATRWRVQRRAHEH